MACSCTWPDDFCSKCRRQFICGSAGEPCPEEGCNEKRMRDEFHDDAHTDFIEEMQPERLHDPAVDAAP